MRNYDEIPEPISIQVGRWLVRRGYGLASCTGLARSASVESDSIGLLIPSRDDSEPRTYPFVSCGIHENFSKRLFVGTIWFDNYPRRADKKNWVFEVYGEKYFEPFQNLAKELSSTFNVDVVLNLVQDQPETKILVSDIVPL